MKPVIVADRLTKDFGEGRGIFDINLSIDEGEMVGFAGTNGSGKTTSVRSFMGFLRPTSGHAYVKGKEAWEHSSEYLRDIGYVPGEIAFPDLRTGVEFLHSQAEFLGLSDFRHAEQLIERLQLDPRASLKRMSKGMKQKTAIVAALMADPSIIILDEPTTGLDPLMRDAFLDIIREEHRRGKTILMSSHMFGELETTCDRVALISAGRIEHTVSIEEIRHPKKRQYKIEFNRVSDYEKFKSLGFSICRDQTEFSQVTVELSPDELNGLFAQLKECDVKFISEVTWDLDRYFRQKLKI